MSRGPGKTQRAIVEALGVSEGRRLTTRELAEAVYGPAPTEAQARATRRAIAGLANRGILVVRREALRWRTGTRRRLSYEFRGDCGDPCEYLHYETDQRRTKRHTRLITDPLKATTYGCCVVTQQELAAAKAADRGRGVHIVVDDPYVEAPLAIPVPGNVVELRDEQYERAIAAARERWAAAGPILPS
jgi:hypothetical protein